MAIWDNKLHILRPDIAPGRRILVISDIHGNLPYFKALLRKVGFCPNDVLIIDGDFLEKGWYSLDTLHFVMELCARGNTYALAGNCDCWSEAVDTADLETGGPRLLNYMLFKRSGLLYEMFLDSGIEVYEGTDVAAAMPVLRRRYADEWNFIRTMPVAVETPHYVFVHGGVRPDIPLDEQRSGDCMKLDNFRGQGWSFNKWVIVGHWPVMLYNEAYMSAYPIIDRDRHIISIDGGCVLEDHGQLNALVIPSEGSEDFSCVWYDPFPLRRVKSAQPCSKKSYFIRWGDSEVKVIDPGAEFSRCRHVRTGYEMDILTKYLYTDENGVIHTRDCSDYVPALNPGDEVSVIETTTRGYYIKHMGVVGWYYGEFE